MPWNSLNFHNANTHIWSETRFACINFRYEKSHVETFIGGRLWQILDSDEKKNRKKCTARKRMQIGGERENERKKKKKKRNYSDGNASLALVCLLLFLLSFAQQESLFFRRDFDEKIGCSVQEMGVLKNSVS